jgi:hypothetical protein
VRLNGLWGVLAALMVAILIPTSAATTPRARPVAPPAGMMPSFSPRPPYTIHGLLTLLTTNLLQAGSACAGQGGYADIQAGMPVTITDVTGRVIRTGRLGAGRGSASSGAALEGACEFEFAISEIPELAVYGIRLDQRGTLRYSLAEMKRLNWVVRLQLSSD